MKKVIDAAEHEFVEGEEFVVDEFIVFRHLLFNG